MKTSETTAAFDVAMLAAQKEIDSAKETAFNKFHGSNYADIGDVIAAVKGPLNANGIFFMQSVEQGEGGIYVETVFKHAESGEFYMMHTPVAVAKQNDSQAMKSGSTYSKRIAIQSFCGLPTEDDDGQVASKAPKNNVIHTKPAKTADSMKTDACTAWIQKHSTEEAAIEAIRAKYTLDTKAIQHIKSEFAKKVV